MRRKSISILISVLISITIIEAYAQNGAGGSWDPSDIEPATSVAAGIATAAALAFVGYETLMSRNERKNTLRAWVGLGEPRIFVDGYFNKDEKFMNREKYSDLNHAEKQLFGVENVRRYLEIKNYGQLPATNIQARTKFIVDTNPTRELLKSEEYYSSATIMPHGALKLFFIITSDEELSIENPEKECNFIWELKYESPKGKERKYGEITNISINKFGASESWDEND